MNDFLIADIHGCLKTLKALINDLTTHYAIGRLVFLGDYIDRGPDSRGVLEYLIELKQGSTFDVITLRGNHEQLMLDAMRDIRMLELWLINHGDTTLANYGISASDIAPGTIAERIPEEQLDFLSKMPLYYENPAYIAVHAGFNFEKDDYTADHNAMLWSRNWQPEPGRTGGRPVIHGHTPIPLEQIQYDIEANKPAINLDNGCKFTELPGYGNLLAYEPYNRKIVIQPNIE